jgi:Aminomethyltransferase beta-barrel domain
VWAAAPGQAAVFYDGEELLGGGRIEVPVRNEIESADSRREPVLASA